MSSGGYLWLYAFAFIPVLLILGALAALVVMLFMTARNEPDPRGVLPRSAFALSVSFAGLMVHIAAWGAIAIALGVQANANSCAVSQHVTVRTSASLAQAPPQPPMPPMPMTPVFTMPPMVRPTMSIAPMSPPSYPAPDYPLPDGIDEGSIGRSVGPLVACTDDTARRVASAFPYLVVSGVALGGGSRMFRRLLNEERAHDPA